MLYLEPAEIRLLVAESRSSGVGNNLFSEYLTRFLGENSRGHRCGSLDLASLIIVSSTFCFVIVCCHV